MKPAIIKAEEVEKLARGGGIVTIPLVTKESVADARFTTGISIYPRGTGAPPHWHNCDEQVTVLGGESEVEIDGAVTPLERYDSTYIPEGKKHAFRNRGEGPMTILWVYSSDRVTRTLADTGETVEHLSADDVLAKRDERPVS